MKRLWTITLALGLLLSPVPATADDEPIVLSGTYHSLTRAMQNLMRAMSKPEPDFAPEQVQVRFEVLDVGKLPLPANAVENYVDRTTPEDLFEAQKIRFEGLLGRRVKVTHRKVPAVELAALDAEFERTAEELWPFYQKILGRAPPTQMRGEGEPEFVSPWKVLWESITNKGNLKKAALRFSLNTTLVGLSLASFEDMTPAQATLLATAGGGGSFLLMAGNDLYKAWLASPFWTKLPSPHYVKQAYLDQADPAKKPGGGRFRALKAIGMGVVKDTFVITGYVAVIMGVSHALGVGPETVAEGASNFLKTLGLSIWTETSFNLLNAGLTARALEDLPSDPVEREAKIRRVRGYSATGALIQSPIVTVLQILASVGSVAGQTALLGLGGVGVLGYYTLVLVPPNTKLGRLRERYIMPFLKDPVAKIRIGMKKAAEKTTQAGKTVTRAVIGCSRIFSRLWGGGGGAASGH